MSALQTHQYDTRKRIFTKKIRSIDLTPAQTTAKPTVTLFRPVPGRDFLVKNIWTQVKSVAGTVSDTPNILIDNGTDASNVVADVALVATDELVVQHTIAAIKVINYANPLRLKKTDEATGATAFLINIIIEMVELTQ